MFNVILFWVEFLSVLSVLRGKYSYGNNAAGVPKN